MSTRTKSTPASAGNNRGRLGSRPKDSLPIATAQADEWLPPIERMSGWAHESIWFIERQRLADIIHERDGKALLHKLHGPFRWMIPHHGKLVREIIDTWTTSTDDLDKLDSREWAQLRVEGERDGYLPTLDSIHREIRTLISKL